MVDSAVGLTPADQSQAATERLKGASGVLAIPTFRERVRFAFARSASAAKAPSSQERSDPAREWALSVAGKTSVRRSSKGVPVDPFREDVVAHRCVNVLSTTLSSTPWRIESGETRVEPAALMALLEEPNDVMTWERFAATVTMLALANGHSFFRLGERNSRNLPRSLTPLAASVTPVRPDGELYTLLGWKIGDKIVPAEDVARLEFSPDPADPLLAVSPLRVARKEFEADKMAAVLQRASLQQGGNLKGLLKYTGAGRPTVDQLDLVEARFNERYSGFDITEGYAVLGDNFEFQNFGVNMNDLQLIEGRQFLSERIAQLYGVPPLFLGQYKSQGLSDAGLSIQKKIFYEQGVQPFARQFEAAINRFIVRPFDPTLRFVFDFDDVDALKENYTDKLDQALKLTKLGVSLNKANRVIGLGLEDEPWGDEALVSDGLTTATSVVELAGLPPEGVIPAAAPPSDEPDRAIEVTDDSEARYWRDHVRTLDPVEKKALGRLRRNLLEQRAAVLRALRGDEARGHDDEEDEIDEDKQKVEGKNVLVAGRQFNAQSFGASAAASMSEAYAVAGIQLLTELSGLGIPDVSNIEVQSKRLPQLAKVYADRRIGAVVKIGDEIRAAVNATLIEGLRAGDNLTKMQARVRAVFNASASRARTIARTETAIAAQTSRFGAMGQSGVKYKSWVTSQDEYVRKTHQEAQAEGIILIDEPFGNGLMHPGAAGPASEIVNCRCQLRPRTRR